MPIVGMNAQSARAFDGALLDRFPEGRHARDAAVVVRLVPGVLEPEFGHDRQGDGVLGHDCGVHFGQTESFETVVDDRSRRLGSGAAPPRRERQSADELGADGDLRRLDLGVPDEDAVTSNAASS
jgi:hypothetical protein